jgi:hypothetical protein
MAKIYHRFKSTLPDEESETDIKPQRDWGDSHVDENGDDIEIGLGGLPSGNYRISQLIEKKVITEAVTSTTFADLDGNDTDEFLIVFQLEETSPSNGSYIKVEPNADTGNNYSNTMFYEGGAIPNWPVAKMILYGFGWLGVNTVNGKFTLQTKTGVPRTAVVEGFDVNDTPNQYSHRTFNSMWLNKIDNITSLVLTTNGTGFTGKLKLYKMIDLVIS